MIDDPVKHTRYERLRSLLAVKSYMIVGNHSVPTTVGQSLKGMSIIVT